MKTGRHLQRLTALEQVAAARLPRADLITMSEWREWHETCLQPQRWIGNAAIQQKVQQMLERQRQVDETLAAFDEAEVQHEQSAQAAAASA